MKDINADFMDIIMLPHDKPVLPPEYDDINLKECKNCKVITAHHCMSFHRTDGGIDYISTCLECNQDTKETRYL